MLVIFFTFLTALSFATDLAVENAKLRRTKSALLEVLRSLSEESQVGSDTRYETVEQKASYGIGLETGQELIQSGLEGLNVDAIADGIATVLNGDEPIIEIDEINNALAELYNRADNDRQYAAELVKEEGEAFLTQNALRSEVNVLESGLQYEILMEGSGEIPTDSSQVRVHYYGQLLDGTVFESSYSRGEPVDVRVNYVIKGWSEALQLMRVGSKWMLYIPQDLAYGEAGAGDSIPPFSTLVFELLLLDII